MLLSKSKRGNRSYLHCSDLAKASSKLFHKQIGLFERGEVAAAIQPVPINQIRIALLGPTARHAEKLFREDAAAHRYSNRFIAAFVEAFPIETRRGGCCVRKPVQHDVIQHLIASERILGISMAIGPRPEFFENPGGLASR